MIVHLVRDWPPWPRTSRGVFISWAAFACPGVFNDSGHLLSWTFLCDEEIDKAREICNAYYGYDPRCNVVHLLMPHRCLTRDAREVTCLQCLVLT